MGVNANGNDFKNIGTGFVSANKLLKDKELNNPPDQEPESPTREIELENNPKQKKSILWYGILINCGILSIVCFPGFAFLILPFQVGSFALIPFNKQTNSFDYSEYKKKLTDEQKNEIDKINKESQENKRLMVPPNAKVEYLNNKTGQSIKEKYYSDNLSLKQDAINTFGKEFTKKSGISR